MDMILLILRLLFAAVFFTSGIAKLFDQKGAQQAIIDFGLPKLLAKPVAILLPLGELAIATALVSVILAWWGAVGAIGLLIAFNIGIAVNLVRGRAPECHCFGKLDSKPIGWTTLARNFALIAAGVLIVWYGSENVGPSVINWLTSLTAIQLLNLFFAMLVLGILASQAWFIIHLMRQQGRLLIRLDALEARLDSANNVVQAKAPAKQAIPERGLPIGAKAPTFNLTRVDGENVSLETLLSPAKPLVFLFHDSGCGPCAALMPEIAQWQQKFSSHFTVALISRNAPKKKAKAEYEIENLLIQPKGQDIFRAYQVTSTPTAVLVQPNGRLGSRLAMGRDAIRNLVSQIVPTTLPIPPTNASVNRNFNGRQSGVIMPQILEVGASVPDFSLPDLTGQQVDLKNLLDTNIVLFFWNPDCGFCKVMLDKVREWEDMFLGKAPKLIFISRGSVEANKKMGLQSPVLLDQDFTASRIFGARGTPSAVFIDSNGRIESKVAIGAQEITNLILSFG